MPEQPETVPQPIWERFVQHSYPVRVEAGELLREPGEREDTTYLVAHGLVRLYHPDRKGNAALSVVRAGTLTGSHCTRLGKGERRALSELPVPFEPLSLPYG